MSFLTPKAISNRIKAKGLQKLRWYCQMCEKQCRDENGFKCHATSEAHLRNMQMFAQAPGKFLERFSREFRAHFVRELSRQHHTNRVKANEFYAKYVSDKDHLHMNATRWRSLTEFIMDLSREGVVKAEETEKGWYIAWIDRTPNAEANKKEARDRAELDDAERDRVRSLRQLQAARESGGAASDHAHATALAADAEKIQFAIPSAAEDEPAAEEEAPLEFGTWDDGDDGGSTAEPEPPKKPRSNLEEIAMREQERRNKRAKVEAAAAAAAKAAPPPTGWLVPGVVVKVLSKKLGDGAYYKQKGTVFAVHNGGSVGDVNMADSGDAIRVAADQLETVVPALGAAVVIVALQHPRRLETATLLRLDLERFSAELELSDKTVVSLPYEAFCKKA